MRWDVALAVLALVTATLAAIPPIVGQPWAMAPVVLFLACGLTAALQIGSKKTARQLVTDLGQDRYRPLYHATLARLMSPLRRFFGVAPPRPEAGIFALLYGAMTFRMLDRAVLIAVLYPVALMLFYWGISGNDAKLGGVVILPAATPAWTGYATLGLLTFMLCTPLYQRAATASPKRFWQSVSHWLPIITVASAVAFAIAIAGVLAVAVTSAVVSAGVGVGAFAVVSAVAVAVVVVFAVLFAVLFAIHTLAERRRTFLASLLLLLAPAIAILAMAYAFDWPAIAAKEQAAPAPFLFLAVLPLLNALFDAASYALTLALLHRGQHGFALLWGIMDLAFALLLFLGLGAVLTWAVATLNSVTGHSFVDLGGLLAQAGDVSQYWWLYAMLFSTALPTFLHLCLASLSLQTVLPRHWRRRLAQHISQANGGSRRSSAIAVLGLGGLWTVGLLLPVAVLGGLGWIIWFHGLETFLLTYRDWLLMIAQWAQGI